MKMGIVVLSKYGEYLRRFLDQVFQVQPDWREACEIVVGSDGISAEHTTPLKEKGVVVLDMPPQFNFARNVNLCAKALSPDSDVFLANDDAVVETHDFVNILQGLFLSQPQDMKYKPYGAISLAISKGAVGNAEQRYGYPGSEHNAIRPVSFICFIAVAISRRAWDDVGGMDEAFVGYGFEDNDWCRRAVQKGYRLGVTPLVKADHGFGDFTGSSSFKRDLDVQGFENNYSKNMGIYKSKWGEKP